MWGIRPALDASLSAHPAPDTPLAPVELGLAAVVRADCPVWSFTRVSFQARGASSTGHTHTSSILKQPPAGVLYPNYGSSLPGGTALRVHSIPPGTAYLQVRLAPYHGVEGKRMATLPPARDQGATGYPGGSAPSREEEAEPSFPTPSSRLLFPQDSKLEDSPATPQGAQGTSSID